MSGSTLTPGGNRPRDGLRLCYVSETLTAGVGRHLVDLVGVMSARGHRVHLIHSPARTNPAYAQAIQKMPGVTMEAVPMRRAPHPQDLVAAWRIARSIRRHGPFDVLHGHSSKGGALIRLLPVAWGLPRFYTPHAFVTMSQEIGRSKRLAYGAIERGLSYLADRILCVSAMERDHARDQLGIAARRLAVVTNGCDIDVASHARDGKALTIGFVGRLDDQKDPCLLITAIAPVLKRHDHVRLQIVGDGPLGLDARKLARDLGVTEKIDWLGAVEARRHIGFFDLLVMSSRYEGFPYVLLEALGAGLPIVTTRVGGSAETVEHGVNGFVAPVGDAAALESHVETLVADPGLRARFAEAARLRSAAFTTDRMADDILKVYQTVRESPARPGMLSRLMGS